MSGDEVLAFADAALLIWKRAEQLMKEKLKKGEITAKEQQERIDKVKTIEERVGLDPEG